LYVTATSPSRFRVIFIENSANSGYFIVFWVLDPALKEPKHLPCLELDSGAQLFMADAAVKYLMSGVEEDSDSRSQVCQGGNPAQDDKSIIFYFVLVVGVVNNKVGTSFGAKLISCL
jgi:hypothetical protein